MIAQRTADLGSAVVLAGFGVCMIGELEGVPVEGALFPLWTLYLILAASALLALRALLAGKGKEVSFFASIPPRRWLGIGAIFICQVLGALYFSFLISMGFGMLFMTILLTPVKTGRAILGDTVFSVGMLAFFQFFFTGIMRIYFPEYLW